MSIEADMERIAAALERIADHTSHFSRLTMVDGEAADVNGEAEVAVDQEALDADEAKAAKKAKAAKAAAAKKAKAEAAEAEAAEAEAETATDEKPKGPSKAAVRAALQEYMATDGKDAAIELLGEHADGAENLSQLKEEHYQAVMDAIAEAG